MCDLPGSGVPLSQAVQVQIFSLFYMNVGSLDGLGKKCCLTRFRLIDKLKNMQTIFEKCVLLEL